LMIDRSGSLGCRICGRLRPVRIVRKRGAIPQSKRRHHELAMVGVRPWTEIQYRGFRVPTVPVYGFTLPVAL
jgi:hypothetical protein